MTITRRIRVAFYRMRPDEAEILELVRDPQVLLADKKTLLRRLNPKANEEDALRVAQGGAP